MAGRVYVDRLFVFPSKNRAAFLVGERNGHQWCHLWADDTGALHAMAQRLGMKREWFQDKPGFPHYDLTPGKRMQALKHGAVERDLNDWLRHRTAALESEQKQQGFDLG